MARTGFPPGGVPSGKQMEEVRGDAPALVEVELRAVRVDLDGFQDLTSEGLIFSAYDSG